MTSDELAALAALERAATAPPWEAKHYPTGNTALRVGEPGRAFYWLSADRLDDPAQLARDLTLVAALRNAAPALLAEVARLTDELVTARALVRDFIPAANEAMRFYGLLRRLEFSDDGLDECPVCHGRRDETPPHRDDCEMALCLALGGRRDAA